MTFPVSNINQESAFVPVAIRTAKRRRRIRIRIRIRKKAKNKQRVEARIFKATEVYQKYV